MTSVTFSFISIVAIVARSAYAVEHTVGDANGWTNSGDYTTWAADKTFNVGDTLVFNYGGSHGVDVLSKSDYDNCATSNAINSYTGGKTTVKLTQPGPMYFACPSFGHCSFGMKLAINVVAQSATTPTTTTPSSGSNPSPPSPTTTTFKPSTSNDTPSTGSSFSSINMVVVWFSLIMAPVFVFMC